MISLQDLYIVINLKKLSFLGKTRVWLPSNLVYTDSCPLGRTSRLSCQARRYMVILVTYPVHSCTYTTQPMGCSWVFGRFSLYCYFLVLLSSSYANNTSSTTHHRRRSSSLHHHHKVPFNDAMHKGDCPNCATSKLVPTSTSSLHKHIDFAFLLPCVHRTVAFPCKCTKSRIHSSTWM